MQGLAFFFVKDQINILGFVGHMVCVAITQLFHCNVKAAIENMFKNEHGCVPIKLYLQNRQQAGFSPQNVVCQSLI